MPRMISRYSPWYLPSSARVSSAPCGSGPGQFLHVAGHGANGVQGLSERAGDLVEGLFRGRRVGVALADVERHVQVAGGDLLQIAGQLAGFRGLELGHFGRNPPGLLDGRQVGHELEAPDDIAAGVPDGRADVRDLQHVVARPRGRLGVDDAVLLHRLAHAHWAVLQCVVLKCWWHFVPRNCSWLSPMTFAPASFMYWMSNFLSMIITGEGIC